MNLPTRPNSLQTYQLLLYRKALHPELFSLKGRRTLTHGAYELEAWIMPGSHVMRFKYDGFCACELVTDQDGSLPVDGAVTAFPCQGEHEYDHKFTPERVNYMTTVQTETLSENLYAATYEEMVDFSKETGALIHRWNDVDGGKCLSMLDVQRLAKEVHAQAYHLMAHGGLVLRTQTIFEHR
jgi:hypothetical protein